MTRTQFIMSLVVIIGGVLAIGFGLASLLISDIEDSIACQDSGGEWTKIGCVYSDHEVTES